MLEAEQVNKSGNNVSLDRHINTMSLNPALKGVDIKSDEFINSLRVIGKDEKGRDVLEAFVYKTGKSFIEGVNSVCIAQPKISTWGWGRRFHNSETNNPFEDSILDNTTNKELANSVNKVIKYRFAFVQVGDKTTPEQAQKILEGTDSYIRSLYSNNVLDILTKEQTFRLESLEPTEAKAFYAQLQTKLLMKDVKGNIILDNEGKKVYRQSFLRSEIVDDVLNGVIWKMNKVTTKRNILTELLKA